MAILITTEYERNISNLYLRPIVKPYKSFVISLKKKQIYSINNNSAIVAQDLPRKTKEKGVSQKQTLSTSILGKNEL